MRKRTWKLVTGLVVLLTLGTVAYLTLFDRPTDKKSLIVATSGTLYPTSYHEPKSSKLVGFDIDVMRAVAQDLNLPVQFRELNVDGQLTAVKTGKADIAINDFGITQKRKQHYLMSRPFKHSFDSLIVRAKDDSGIHTWDDIKGKKAAGEAGTSYQRLAQQLGAQLVNYDNVSNDVYINDVKTGKTDFIMNDYYLQKLALKANPHSGLKIQSNMYFNIKDSSIGEGMLINKDNPTLQKRVNHSLTKLMKNGKIRAISLKYYGADVTKQPKEHISKVFTLDSSDDGRS